VENAELINNYQKYLNYSEQFKRLNKAIINGFNLEAIFIEYAIMEDRTESILRHSGYWDSYIKSRKGREPNMDTKIKYIIKKAENRTDYLHKYFSDNTLEQILKWKEERNRLIHALLKQKLNENEIRNLAIWGDTLTKVIRTKASSYNRYVERKRFNGML